MIAESNAVRIAIVWPRPRAQRWHAGGVDTPDQSDALRYLEEHGFRLQVEDSTAFPLNPFARMHEFWSGLDVARAARLWSRSRQYDLVIGVGDAVAYYPMLAQKWLGWKMPFVMIDPALSHDYPRRQRLQDFVLPRAERVIVFGQVQLDHLRERYGSRVRAELILHRADTEFYCPGDTPEAESGNYVVSVGGDKSRDFDTLAAAMAIARRSVPEIRCIIKTHLDVQMNSTAIQVDRKPLSWVELRDLYRRARFVVLPLHDSLHAGGINTLVEAMSTAKGVIVSDSRGIRDYLRPSQTVEAVAPADPESLAAAMVRLWRDPVAADRLGSQARAFVVEQCDNRVYAAQLARILRDLLVKRGRFPAEPKATDLPHAERESAVSPAKVSEPRCEVAQTIDRTTV